MSQTPERASEFIKEILLAIEGPAGKYENGVCPVCGTRASEPVGGFGNSKRRYLPVTVGDDWGRNVGWNSRRLQHICSVCRCVFVEEVEAKTKPNATNS